MDTSNITSTIISTINTIFSKLFSSIDNSVYSMLDDFVFINSDILKDDYFADLFGIPSRNGILLIANALVLGFLLYYAFRFLLSHFGIIESEKPTKFIFKLIIFGICMNFSLFICDQIIYLNSLISGTLRFMGEKLYNFPISFSTLISELNSVITINGDSLDIFSLDGILKTIISGGILNLTIVYSIRYVLIKVFILISPFAFLSLTTPPTSILFKSWFKSFISLLLVQDFVSIVLLLIFSFNFKSSSSF